MAIIQGKSITLECCACGFKKSFMEETDIYQSNWSLWDGKGKRVDLCPPCSRRQDARDEQESQILGNPPKRIEPMKKNEDVIAEANKAIAVADKVLNASGITVRARFKLESIDVVVGETLISGEMSESKEITLPMSGSELKIGQMYHLPLVK